ncbi:hypothetical protein GXW82_06825 [Streptacidiphilus sp. 4-A2]|nr:hypothetical protein [Streptacidiphilus sp. 4-A2]
MTTDTVRAAAAADAYRDGERLFDAAAVDHLESGYGGLNADVTDEDTAWQVWVGVNGRTLTGECDCPQARPEVLCAHGVATALAAVAAGISWPSAVAAEAGAPQGLAESRFLALAGTLGAERLAALVARHAVRDRLLATELEVATGQLGAPVGADLAALRALTDQARSIPDGDDDYDLYDIVRAVRAVLAELDALALRPPTPELLDAAEYAVESWDRLACVLAQDWRTSRRSSRPARNWPICTWSCASS